MRKQVPIEQYSPADLYESSNIACYLFPGFCRQLEEMAPLKLITIVDPPLLLIHFASPRSSLHSSIRAMFETRRLMVMRRGGTRISCSFTSLALTMAR
jgi:hypothetical protein